MNPIDAVATLLAAEHDPAVRALPEYEAARAAVDADEELRERFEGERAFYAEHDGLLSAVTLRPEARARIQAAVEAEAAQPAAGGILAFPRRRLVLAAAAAALFAVGLGWVLLGGGGTKVDGTTFQEFASRSVEAGLNPQAHPKTTGEAFDWLREHSAPHEDGALGAIADHPAKACMVVDWNGAKVSIVCMQRNREPMMHLFIVDRSSVPDHMLAEPGGRAVVDNHETYSWKDEQHAYVLVAHEARRPLKIPPGLVAGAS